MGRASHHRHPLGGSLRRECPPELQEISNDVVRGTDGSQPRTAPVTSSIDLEAVTFALTVMVQQVLKVPIAGSVLLFLAAAACYLFSAASIGIFLGTLARSMPQTAAMMA